MPVDNEMNLRNAALNSSVKGYEDDAGRALAARYESINPDVLHADILRSLPSSPAAVIDIGAGSGRDAAWFASKGHSVLAVEPSKTMREEGHRLHPNSGIEWFDDCLPDLSKVYGNGMSFDVAMLSAVWMHVPPKDRERAFRRVVNLLKPNGMIVIRLRVDPIDEARGMHAVSAEEIVRLARGHGAVVLTERVSDDLLGRDQIWNTFVLKFPDDGTGALPRLRHVILNDAKSATYKLGLLRSVARAADSSRGLAIGEGEDSDIVKVPLGLIALNWLRLYMPMTNANLPQSPDNREGTERLSFAGKYWSKLSDIDACDFRVGGRFTGDVAIALHQTLKSISTTIRTQPATHMKDPRTKAPIMPVPPFSGESRQAKADITLDADYLRSFGEIHVPVEIWQALARFGAWVEPALMHEWGRLIESYAEGQKREIDPGDLMRAMRWHEPMRDVLKARKRASSLMKKGSIHCVWTGKKLKEMNFDVDHCMPWAAWPCGDLWNLMPTHPSVNRNSKRHRLPAAATLERSSDRILDWWDRAWHGNAETQPRFLIEAQASLPMLPENPDLESIFAGVQSRRFVIRADQGVEEWFQ